MKCCICNKNVIEGEILGGEAYCSPTFECVLREDDA